MSSRYDVIRPDTLEEMRRAGHIAKLEARIEKLEAALREIASASKVVARKEDMAEALAVLFSSHKRIALTALEEKE